jgi:hypothetical protein
MTNYFPSPSKLSMSPVRPSASLASASSSTPSVPHSPMRFTSGAASTITPISSPSQPRTESSLYSLSSPTSTSAFAPCKGTCRQRLDFSSKTNPVGTSCWLARFAPFRALTTADIFVAPICISKLVISPYAHPACFSCTRPVCVYAPLHESCTCDECITFL